ncbi:MAG TPA: DUF3795 domain-containing protein [Phototrophicaceae bacterium]|nr:DUF3795 domain-containing protein [Phototrophicaceae bacterium]
MKMIDSIPANLLAPCGINCMACYVHLKTKKACQGCRGADESKPEHCRKCQLKDCAVTHQVAFCGDCVEFPCAAIKRLDKSYRQRYQVSLIANARQLKAVGMTAYLLAEKARWTCTQCGGVISQHDRACSECGQAI